MEKYKTSDLYLAAYLLAHENKVKCIKQGNKCFFHFENILSRYVEDFFNNGLISVTKYKNAIQDLKTLIYNT